MLSIQAITIMSIIHLNIGSLGRSFIVEGDYLTGGIKNVTQQTLRMWAHQSITSSSE